MGQICSELVELEDDEQYTIVELKTIIDISKSKMKNFDEFLELNIFLIAKPLASNCQFYYYKNQVVGMVINNDGKFYKITHTNYDVFFKLNKSSMTKLGLSQSHKEYIEKLKKTYIN